MWCKGDIRKRSYVPASTKLVSQHVGTKYAEQCQVILTNLTGDVIAIYL